MNATMKNAIAINEAANAKVTEARRAYSKDRSQVKLSALKEALAAAHAAWLAVEHEVIRPNVFRAGA